MESTLQSITRIYIYTYGLLLTHRRRQERETARERLPGNHFGAIFPRKRRIVVGDDVAVKRPEDARAEIPVRYKRSSESRFQCPTCREIVGRHAIGRAVKFKHWICPCSLGTSTGSRLLFARGESSCEL